MINLNDINKYRENNRLEVKKAAGGLPQSIWETYSAFANTNGGIIILGIEELADRSLNIVGLTNPDKLLKEFWDIINDTQKVSINILRNNNVQIIEYNEKNVIIIEVPRANRHDKPIYIGRNPFKGTYRRNGEGDYHCSDSEIKNMIRDSGDEPQDLLVLDRMDFSVFDKDTINKYRNRLASLKPGHVWLNLSDDEFLQRIGAVGRSETNKSLHPTIAGLLMFGYEYEIVKEFPNYFLDYQEKSDDNRWVDRVVSNSGDWSGNLFDFYFRIYNKLVVDINVPFRLDNSKNRVDDTPVHEALREALANALIHANYYGRQGIVIIKKKNSIVVSNPGGMRISIAEAFSGGVSDPRNSTIFKMFSLIGIGERAGSGLSNINFVWKQQGWDCPKLEETFNPERTTLTLVYSEVSTKKSAIKIGDKKSAIKIGDKRSAINKYKEKIIDYLSVNSKGKTSDIAEFIGLKSSRTRQILGELIKKGIIIFEGNNKNRIYKLK